MFTMKVDGLRELEAELQKIEGVYTRRNAGRRALRTAADPIAERARQLAPDDPETGAPEDLTQSIIVSTRQKSGPQRRYRKLPPHVIEVHIGPNTEGYPQAMPQEFGFIAPDGSEVAAQPYLRPAWQAEGELKALKRIVVALRGYLKRRAARSARKK